MVMYAVAVHSKVSNVNNFDLNAVRSLRLANTAQHV
jgi:hypothetical protein